MTKASVSHNISVEKPTEEKLKNLKIKSWPIWTKESSTFDWYYDEPETCYFLEGKVTVSTSAGDVTIQKGDLVTFPQGLKCVWRVQEAVKKHYQFG
ncbi:MAG: cupin domain-containing protein [Candidatus Omnitrophica bacterium]|nr:cupin domain-containing protein [Candidatus Omnitrophota bacterium]